MPQIQFLEQLESITDENSAFIICDTFSVESIEQIISLNEQGYQIELESDDERIDHHFVVATLFDDQEEGEIMEQVVIQG